MTKRSIARPLRHDGAPQHQVSELPGTYAGTLSQPLDASPGDVIQISLPSETDDEMSVWRDAEKQHLLDAYADEDAIYDEL